jgi:hypothetical protein
VVEGFPIGSKGEDGGKPLLGELIYGVTCAEFSALVGEWLAAGHGSSISLISKLKNASVVS